MDQSSTTRIRANGALLNVQRGGAGRPLLFLNGTNSAIITSEPLLARLRRCSRLIALDHRGMGESSSPEGDWTMADYANDALAVMDTLGLTTFDVLGVSFGGMVAQELAVRSPERVQRLVLWSTSAGGSSGSSFALESLGAMDESERDATLLKLLDSRFNEEWLSVHPRDRMLVGSRTSPATNPSSAASAAMMKQLRARASHDVSDRLGVLGSTPVFVGAGRYDIMAPPVNGEAIARLTGASRFELYEGGHLFFFQDPRAFTDLEEFLGSVD